MKLFLLLIMFSQVSHSYVPEVSAEATVKFANSFDSLGEVLNYFEPVLDSNEFKQTKKILKDQNLFDLKLSKKWKQSADQVLYDKQAVLSFKKDGSFLIQGEIFKPFRKGHLDSEVKKVLSRLNLLKKDKKNNALKFKWIEAAHAVPANRNSQKVVASILGGFLSGKTGGAKSLENHTPELRRLVLRRRKFPLLPLKGSLACGMGGSWGTYSSVNGVKYNSKQSRAMFGTKTCTEARKIRNRALGSNKSDYT